MSKLNVLIEGVRVGSHFLYEASKGTGPFGGKSFVDAPRKGSGRHVKEVIEAAIKKRLTHPSMVSMFRGWIEGGLYSSQGEFKLHNISRAVFEYVNKDNASFTADVVLAMAPDYKRTVKKRYVWKMRGRSYKGIFK